MNRVEQLTETNNSVIEKLSELKKSTVFELSAALNWTIGKTQGSLMRLIEQGKIFKVDFPDFESKKFKVLYAIDPKELEGLSPVVNQLSINVKEIAKVPTYYKFLDDLFGNILSGDKVGRKVLLEQIKLMNLTIEDVMEMQSQANKEEMQNV